MEETHSSPTYTCPNTVTARRNPHRKARPTPATTAPAAASSSKPRKPTTVSAFPIDDILSIDVTENLPPEACLPSSSSAAQKSAGESLRVFLRIRPLQVRYAAKSDGNADQSSRAKNAWPQNPKRKAPAKPRLKKEAEECITLNDSQSITLSPPLAFQDSKRMKSEVYEGFSHVFSGNSSQEEVYEKMVNPLVEDFLMGKSGMVAALGPSGSGKTHTVFGCPRDPGMVPLALQRIFKRNDSSGSGCSRSFYLSMFEICSERGKGERLIDLSPDGAELSMQQSALRGLQEAVISDLVQAESLIARGMLKRATAMTNSNSQSSRSQCIINIRASNKSNAVLTIVDLAGAEREKRTGNQGARLLESNFINNTSMVFGLCLRSLLEHQKNPKKPLQKHFQNSLLTRYLRDYLEGKKRMTLVLTVKPGEEDYLDASYLLRQASPYMKIKFTNIEEQPSLPSNKRDLQALHGVKQPKRLKLGGIDARATENGKSTADKTQLIEKETPKINKGDIDDLPFSKSERIGLARRERNNQIMQNFAKAIWNVLKQNNEKLKAAENEVQSLKEDLRKERTRFLELEKELNGLKSCCACSMKNSADATSSEVTTNCEPQEKLGRCECSNFDEKGSVTDTGGPGLSECNNSASCDSTLEQDVDVFPELECSQVVVPDSLCLKDIADCSYQTEDNTIFVDTKKKAGASSSSREFEFIDNEQVSNLRNSGIGTVHSASDCEEHSIQQDHQSGLEPISTEQCIGQEHGSLFGNGDNAEDLIEKFVAAPCSPDARRAEFVASSPQFLVTVCDDKISLVEVKHLPSEEDVDKFSVSRFCDGSNSLPNYQNGLEPELVAGHCTGQRVGLLRNKENVENFEDSKCSRSDNFLPSVDATDLALPEVATSSLSLVIISDDDSSSSAKLDQPPSVKHGAELSVTSEPPSSPINDADLTQENKVVLESETRLDTCKSIQKKPKRKLLPASSVLLREVSHLDVEDEIEKSKGNRNRGGRKVAAEGRTVTQGSSNLMRLLKSNIRI